MNLAKAKIIEAAAFGFLEMPDTETVRVLKCYNNGREQWRNISIEEAAADLQETGYIYTLTEILHLFHQTNIKGKGELRWLPGERLVNAKTAESLGWHLWKSKAKKLAFINPEDEYQRLVKMIAGWAHGDFLEPSIELAGEYYLIKSVLEENLMVYRQDTNYITFIYENMKCLGVRVTPSNVKQYLERLNDDLNYINRLKKMEADADCFTFVVPDSCFQNGNKRLVPCNPRELVKQIFKGQQPTKTVMVFPNETKYIWQEFINELVSYLGGREGIRERLVIRNKASNVYAFTIDAQITFTH